MQLPKVLSGGHWAIYGSGCFRPTALTSPPEKWTNDISMENTHPWNAGMQRRHKAALDTLESTNRIPGTVPHQLAASFREYFQHI